MPDTLAVCRSYLGACTNFLPISDYYKRPAKSDIAVGMSTARGLRCDRYWFSRSGAGGCGEDGGDNACFVAKADFADFAA